MSPTKTRLPHLGTFISRRREAMGLSQSGLSRLMGGTPGAAFISRVESGHVNPTPAMIARFAEALALPVDPMLLTAGFAPLPDRERGRADLSEIVVKAVPVAVEAPVIDLDYPEVFSHRSVTVTLPQSEDVFAVLLEGRANEPYVGTVIASRTRRPTEDRGVIAEVDGHIGAWTWRTGKPTGDYLVNGQGFRVTKFRLWGVIIEFTPSKVSFLD